MFVSRYGRCQTIFDLYSVPRTEELFLKIFGLGGYQKNDVKIKSNFKFQCQLRSQIFLHVNCDKTRNNFVKKDEDDIVDETNMFITSRLHNLNMAKKEKELINKRKLIDELLKKYENVHVQKIEQISSLDRDMDFWTEKEISFDHW